MKRTVIILAALLCFALCGCGSSVQEEPGEAAVEAVKPEAGGEGSWSGSVEAPQQTIAEFSRDGICMRLPIFEDWEYELIESDVPGIRLWRTGDLKGYAELLYYDMFGVCGTGLEEKEAEFPSGRQARVGYYDGASDWDFVIFDVDGFEGDFAAVNHGLTGGDAKLALSMLGQAVIGE